ncbi:MAG: nucleotidyltransferase family protein [Sedimentisphaerales bacterium]|nr:nucleotidyltransferase family protein [Sedimentisphaerales bacterium]
MESLTKQAIFDLIQSSKPKLQSFGINSIGLFGSFATGRASEDSDIDIFVEFRSDEKTYDNFIDTCFFLEELFGRKVELVTKDSLSPYLGPHILEEVQYVNLTN